LKKNKISKNWIIRQKRDIFVRQSKIEGYRSRAIYKLKEIDEKFKIFKNTTSIIDLGAAPGSWSQYIIRQYKKSLVLAIDLLDFEHIDKVNKIVGDFTKSENKEKIKNFFNKKVDVVISDMAVNTTGNKNLDAIVTGELCIEAMEFALEMLDKKGKFVSKIFMGSSFNEIVADAKKKFREVNIFKPLSSRKDSKESFIICKFLR
jgi:23S rRNA (uridine2552-2'-O)-methyltransferase|tara:strand:- start:10253 stop:10864 length:612 start_codon:yes stop_codon:yes gene_type:complete